MEEETETKLSEAHLLVYISGPRGPMWGGGWGGATRFNSYLVIPSSVLAISDCRQAGGPAVGAILTID